MVYESFGIVGRITTINHQNINLTVMGSICAVINLPNGLDATQYSISGAIDDDDDDEESSEEAVEQQGKDIVSLET